MSSDPVAQTLGDAPLSVLVGTAEERIRQLADRLYRAGALKEDPELAELLTEARVRLWVAEARLSKDS